MDLEAFLRVPGLVQVRQPDEDMLADQSVRELAIEFGPLLHVDCLHGRPT